MRADFNIDSLTEQSRWWGTYRGVNFEIRCTSVPRPEQNGEAWTYYLHINKSQAPERFESWNNEPEPCGYSKRLAYLKYALENLDWHCGVTFYDREFDKTGQVCGITVGCDYSHYWDMGKTYSLSTVLSDAQDTIDDLWNHYGSELRVWCSGNGNYYRPDEGEWQGERFYSHEYTKSLATKDEGGR